jgi:hypothetical protein
VPQRRILKDFVESLELTSAVRFDGVSELPAGARAAALATPGREYAVYLFHAREDGEWGAHFVAAPGDYRDTFKLKQVPEGRYRLEWIEPASGAVRESRTLDWPGGDLPLMTPGYRLDIALHLRANSPR